MPEQSLHLGRSGVSVRRLLAALLVVMLGIRDWPGPDPCTPPEATPKPCGPFYRLRAMLRATQDFRAVWTGDDCAVIVGEDIGQLSRAMSPARLPGRGGGGVPEHYAGRRRPRERLRGAVVSITATTQSACAVRASSAGRGRPAAFPLDGRGEQARRRFVCVCTALLLLQEIIRRKFTKSWRAARGRWTPVRIGQFLRMSRLGPHTPPEPGSLLLLVKTRLRRPPRPSCEHSGTTCCAGGWGGPSSCPSSAAWDVPRPPRAVLSGGGAWGLLSGSRV